MSAVGTLGLINMWNFEELSSVISDYFNLKDGYAKAGACIALGLATTGIYDENDPTMALLADAIQSNDNTMKLGSSIGMGLAYAGCKRDDIRDVLAEIINDENLPVEVSACAALSLGLNFVGRKDEDSINTILSSLMAFEESTLN